MANYVYSTITVHETENWERLEEIVEIGLAEFYRPMPKALDITAPAHSKVEKEMAQANVERYGHTDWYDWRRINHGTKWGDYKRSLSGDNLTFTTAWSPLALAIIEMFALDFPNFTYKWEEEQGYGAKYEFADGEVVEFYEWDMPSWGENGELTDEEADFCYKNDIIWLSEDYSMGDETYVKGYYESHNLEEFLGATLDEAKKELDL